jgi:hypothetical protein
MRCTRVVSKPHEERATLIAGTEWSPNAVLSVKVEGAGRGHFKPGTEYAIEAFEAPPKAPAARLFDPVPEAAAVAPCDDCDRPVGTVRERCPGLARNEVPNPHP